ncbi:hypothetical protein CYLTODRAFT_449083 [Cylindrobasidium torrendii FP15055 ss-10]|uniref:Uncharacterized protein n=1 Tax=Cylindrobasidium torrendii FP15055 ss-10 TaxID=1314674 RepID=A0A0D7BV06_9AGAR|nr:hypothetical protein CYLTODRAFT_449083 [Cylindrobasidium torrendii FP15055 ss-10]
MSMSNTVPLDPSSFYITTTQLFNEVGKFHWAAFVTNVQGAVTKYHWSTRFGTADKLEGVALHEVEAATHKSDELDIISGFWKIEGYIPRDAEALRTIALIAFAAHANGYKTIFSSERMCPHGLTCRTWLLAVIREMHQQGWFAAA